jgi:hypothetical protein
MSGILSQEEVDALLSATGGIDFDDAGETSYSIELRGGGFDFKGRGGSKVIVAAFKAWLLALGGSK